MSSKYFSLWQAVINNNAEKLKELLKNLADVNKVHDEDGRTLLLAACQLQHCNIIKRLLKAKPPANVNQSDSKGRYPIWYYIFSIATLLAQHIFFKTIETLKNLNIKYDCM